MKTDPFEEVERLAKNPLYYKNRMMELQKRARTEPVSL